MKVNLLKIWRTKITEDLSKIKMKLNAFSYQMILRNQKKFETLKGLWDIRKASAMTVQNRTWIVYTASEIMKLVNSQSLFSAVKYEVRNFVRKFLKTIGHSYNSSVVQLLKGLKNLCWVYYYYNQIDFSKVKEPVEGCRVVHGRRSKFFGTPFCVF